MFRMHRRWYGHPQVNTRLPPEQFQAVHAEARRRGIPASHVVKELVRNWYRSGTGDAPESSGDVSSNSLPTRPLNAAGRASDTVPRSLTEALVSGVYDAQARAIGPAYAPRANVVSPKATPTRLPSRETARLNSCGVSVKTGRTAFKD